MLRIQIGILIYRNCHIHKLQLKNHILQLVLSCKFSVHHLLKGKLFLLPKKHSEMIQKMK